MEKIYGNWRVLNTFVSNNISYCSVQCICGVESAVPSYNLKSGRSKQCRNCSFKNRQYTYDMNHFINNKVKKLYRGYQWKAKKENLEFSLDFEIFKKFVLSECYYCGIENSCRIKETVRLPEFKYNGIDRTDNEKGYVYFNCVPCCKLCNMAKKALPYGAWDDWVLRLVTKYPKWGVG